MSNKKSDFSFWQKLGRWIDQQNDVLLRVIKSHGLFVLTGLLGGILLVVLSKFTPYIWEWFFTHIVSADVKGKSTASLIVKEIGVGLIVASIAVFGYEWRSHSKHALELSEKLTEILESKGEEALEGSLKLLIDGDEESPDFRKNIVEFIKTTHNLGRRQTPDTVQYVKVLSWIFQQTVKKNADNLEGLVEDNAGAEWHYNVPSPAEVAARILGAQMKVLTEGDSYDSISMVNFWQDDSLDYFFEKTKIAVTDKGVKVRRIFNLCNYPDLIKEVKKHQSSKYKGKIKLSDVIRKKLDKVVEALKRHEDLSNLTLNYEVKFLTTSHTSAIEANSGFRRAELENSYYGLFKHGNSQQIIKFVAETASLSKMGLGYCQPTDQEVKMFDLLWKEAQGTNPFAILLPPKSDLKQLNDTTKLLKLS